jgi:hypothetical protein
MNVVLAGGKDGSNWAFGPSYRATQCICILCAGTMYRSTSQLTQFLLQYPRRRRNSHELR